MKLFNVSHIYKLLNSFDKNLEFTVDLFENVPHFCIFPSSPFSRLGNVP